MQKRVDRVVKAQLDARGLEEVNPNDADLHIIIHTYDDISAFFSSRSLIIAAGAK